MWSDRSVTPLIHGALEQAVGGAHVESINKQVDLSLDLNEALLESIELTRIYLVG